MADFIHILYIYSVEYACKLWTGLARLPFQLHCDFLLPNGKEVLISASLLPLPCFIIMFWVFLTVVFFLCLSCNYIEQICESADSFVSHCDSVLLRIVNILFVQLVAGTRPRKEGQGKRGANRWVSFLRGSSSMKMCAPLIRNRKKRHRVAHTQVECENFISLWLCLATRRMRNVSCPP